jgi:hypothetical protein
MAALIKTAQDAIGNYTRPDSYSPRLDDRPRPIVERPAGVEAVNGATPPALGAARPALESTELTAVLAADPEPAALTAT